MSEIKPRLNIPKIIVGGGMKSPPTPTKLLISHGKPNYTIDRKAKRKEVIKTDDDEFLRIHNKVKTNTLKTSSENKKFHGSVKTIIFQKNSSNGGVNGHINHVSNTNEFIENFPRLRPTIKKEPSYAHVEERRIITRKDLRKVVTNYEIDSTTSESHINDRLPENPRAFSPHSPTTPPPPPPPLPPTPPTTPATPTSIDGHHLIIRNQSHSKSFGNDHFVSSEKINQIPMSPLGVKPPIKEKPVHLQVPTTPIGSPPVHVINESNQNFKPKTVVSFSVDLSTTPNRYPDTVKVVTSPEPHAIPSSQQRVFEEFSKLKFEIAGNGEKVTQVIRNQ